jgi:hypothetical protein
VIELSIALLAIPAFWAFAEWRYGLLLCIVTAILQDPLRKLTPDQPVFFVGFVAVVFGAACLGALTRGVSLGPGSIRDVYRRIAAPMFLLLLLIVIEAFNSFRNFGNLMLPTIGLLTYLLPFPAILFAYQFVCRNGAASIYRFITSYLVCFMLALTTVYLEYAGYDWPVFGQVGGVLLMYDETLGGRLFSYSGVFRASEIAAWHAMTCACFVFMLLTFRKVSFQSLVTAAVLVAVLMGVGILTGRRKALLEVAVFASTYLVLWVILQKAAMKFGIALAIAGLVGFFWVAGQQENDLPSYVERSSGYTSYVLRSKTVFQDAPSRFVELGIAPVMYAYERFGLFGAGLGVGTQGTQHFGGGGALAGAAEGGLGKITLELGVPGLFVMAWLAVSVVYRIWQIMLAASRVSPPLARLSFGLFSFLVANAAAFSVATQAYGDFFILLMMSWTLGFLLAVPVLLEWENRERRSTISAETARYLDLKTL